MFLKYWNLIIVWYCLGLLLLSKNAFFQRSQIWVISNFKCPIKKYCLLVLKSGGKSSAAGIGLYDISRMQPQWKKAYIASSIFLLPIQNHLVKKWYTNCAFIQIMHFRSLHLQATAICIREYTKGFDLSNVRLVGSFSVKKPICKSIKRPRATFKPPKSMKRRSAMASWRPLLSTKILIPAQGRAHLHP